MLLVLLPHMRICDWRGGCVGVGVGVSVCRCVGVLVQHFSCCFAYVGDDYGVLVQINYPFIFLLYYCLFLFSLSWLYCCMPL